MDQAGATDWRASAVSALEWWRDAGVDMLVDDEPRDWTAREITPTGKADPANAAPVVEPEMPLPVTLEAFVHWRFGGDAPEAGWGEPLALPVGNPAAPLMVMTDMPESDDPTTLVGGNAGRLFDRMLAAIGMDRESVYLVPLCAAHHFTGQVPREYQDRLTELALHHIALTAPKRLLLLGQATERAILGTDPSGMRGRLHSVNYGSGESQAVTTFHPRMLLKRPAAKADAWKDLQLLIGEQDQ